MQVSSRKIYLKLTCLAKQVSSLSGYSETHAICQVLVEHISRNWYTYAYVFSLMNERHDMHTCFEIQASFSELYFILPINYIGEKGRSGTEAVFKEGGK